MNYTRVTHNLPLLINEDSEILILGSFPSVKSRDENFYYMNKQNRFFKILSFIYKEDFYNCDIKTKINLLKKYKIVLFDVVKQCDISGSDDSKIKNVIYNDIENIINNSNITKVYINGNKAYDLFIKQFPNIKCLKLPSTSPANARMNIDMLFEKWQVINI